MSWINTFPPLQVKNPKVPTNRRQTMPHTAMSWSCLRSNPCRFQSRGSSLPTWTASGIWRARCGICSSSWVMPTLRTSCWRGSSIATWWHCSTSKTLRAAFHRLVGLCPSGVPPCSVRLESLPDHCVHRKPQRQKPIHKCWNAFICVHHAFYCCVLSKFQNLLTGSSPLIPHNSPIPQIISTSSLFPDPHQAQQRGQSPAGAAPWHPCLPWPTGKAATGHGK